MADLMPGHIRLQAELMALPRPLAKLHTALTAEENQLISCSPFNHLLYKWNIPHVTVFYIF